MKNSESDHRSEKKEIESSFISGAKTRFRCNKTGYKHYRSEKVVETNQSFSGRPAVNCFRCLELGHIARDFTTSLVENNIRKTKKRRKQMKLISAFTTQLIGLRLA